MEVNGIYTSRNHVTKKCVDELTGQAESRLVQVADGLVGLFGRGGLGRGGGGHGFGCD